MKKRLLGAALLLALPLALRAQDTMPQTEISVGYSLLRYSTLGFVDLKTTNHGWDVSIAPNINQNLAVVLDLAGHYGTFDENISSFEQLQFKFHDYSVMAGPRVSETVGNWRPFAQFLVGYHRLSIDTTDQFLNFTPESDADSSAGVSLTVGGGLDLIRGRFAVRLIQAEYAVQHLKDSGDRIEGARIGAGIIFRLGSRSQ
jgi:hypothetical protein